MRIRVGQLLIGTTSQYYGSRGVDSADVQTAAAGQIIISIDENSLDEISLVLAHDLKTLSYYIDY